MDTEQLVQGEEPAARLSGKCSAVLFIIGAVPCRAVAASQKIVQFVARFQTLVRLSTDLQIIKAALPILSRLIWIEDDVETVQDAVLALSYLSDGPPDRIQAVIEAGVCKRLVDLLMYVAECPVCANQWWAVVFRDFHKVP